MTPCRGYPILGFVTANELKALDDRLDGFLMDLTAPLGRSERRRWAKTY